MIVNIIHDRDVPERLPALDIQIERQGFVCEYWPAVKGDISAAHRAVIRNAMLKGDEMCCVGEDDLMFPSEDGFDYFISKIPNDFSIYLSGVYVGKEQLPNEGNVVKRFSGLHLYIVHSRFYQQFLSLDCSKESIDNALSRQAILGNAKIVCCYPFAAIQQEFKSGNPIMNGVTHFHKKHFNSTNTYGFK